jgi:hypothetical protein
VWVLNAEGADGERCGGIHVAVISARRMLWAGFAALIAFGWWVTAQAPFSTSGTVGVLVAGAALILLARVQRGHTPPSTESGDGTDDHERLWIWAVVFGLLVVWELITLFSHPRDAHPTISSIVDPLQAEHAVRWLLFGGWLAFGWSLAK